MGTPKHPAQAQPQAMPAPTGQRAPHSADSAQIAASVATTIRRATIGKIVRSESHVRYSCQVFGAGEIAMPPAPADYAFGGFVRIPLRATPPNSGPAPADATSADDARWLIAPHTPDALERPQAPAISGGIAGEIRREWADARAWAIGLIYDTLLLNPAFGALGPRLSNDEQVALFSPDYLTERATLVSILLLGTITLTPTGYIVSHGTPPLAPDLGAVATTLTTDEIRAFHFFANPDVPGPTLHMGYLPHAIAQGHPLLPLAILRTVEQLEALFPEKTALLSIVKRNFAWRLKVVTAG